MQNNRQANDAKKFDLHKQSAMQKSLDEKDKIIQYQTTLLNEKAEELRQLKVKLSEAHKRIVETEETLKEFKKPLQKRNEETKQIHLKNLFLLDDTKNIKEKYNNLIEENKDLRRKISDQQQAINAKSHWGWYALGVLGIAVGLALIATGIGAAAGAPLALSIVGSLFVTSLATNVAAAIGLGVTTVIFGLMSAAASIFLISRKMKNDNQCNIILDKVKFSLKALPESDLSKENTKSFSPTPKRTPAQQSSFSSANSASPTSTPKRISATSASSASSTPKRASAPQYKSSFTSANSAAPESTPQRRVPPPAHHQPSLASASEAYLRLIQKAREESRVDQDSTDDKNRPPSP